MCSVLSQFTQFLHSASVSYFISKVRGNTPAEEAPTEEVAEEPTSDETPEAEAAENATDESADESGDDSA